MYVFRIHCQFFLQNAHIAPILATVIAQGTSGLIATAVRARCNYKANIFGRNLSCRMATILMETPREAVCRSAD